MRQYFPALKTCTLLKDFSDGDLEAVLSKLGTYVKHYEKNRVIRSHEIEVTEIGIVLKGMAYIAKNDIFGNRHILAEITEGKTFGESIGFMRVNNSPVYIVAAEETAVAFLPVQQLKQLFSPSYAHSEQLVTNLVLLLAEKNMILQIKNDILSQKTIREKLLLYFEYESKTANSKTFRIHFSREELADFLSLNSSALSRELGKMRDEGLLTFKKNRFTLKN